jgi:NADH-quinone oxidoreductase subunit E/NADP-reducing hydrogenase subunit HndA
MKITENNKYSLKEEEYKKIEEIIDRYRNKNGALIQVLNEIQKEIGFLPISAQKKVANGLDIPEKEVYGVTTFYSFFSLTPQGKTNIRACLGTACFVKGGKKIAERIEKELGIKPGETTEDRKYSLNVNRCLGACGIAPVIMINDKIHQKVKPGKVLDIIKTYEDKNSI